MTNHCSRPPQLHFIDISPLKTYNELQKGAFIMSFSIRLTKEERKLADSYAKLHSLTISEAFKRVLFEKIEDEFDIVLADKAYE